MMSNWGCEAGRQSVRMMILLGIGSMKEKSQNEINKLCRRCIRQCKQPECIVMLECPRFEPRPFKSEKLKFKQLDLFK